ncbi:MULTISPECIES: immunity protein Imm33 domain-containing protein [Sorangium]
MRFLGLPPGWRFLIADEHEDVWKDPSLLNE